MKRSLKGTINVGATSSWLTTLPIKKYGFSLDKTSFWDSLYIRYDISPCVCLAASKLEHALPCPKDGFTSIRHNEVWDFSAELRSEYSKNVSTENVLQQPIGETLPTSATQSKLVLMLQLKDSGLKDKWRTMMWRRSTLQLNST